MVKTTTTFLLAALSATVAQAHLEPIGKMRHLVERQAPASTASTATARAATRTHAASASATSAPAVTGRVASSPLASLSKIGTATTAEATQPLPSTFAAGATPPVANAPKLPSIANLSPANYPALDRIPPIDSPEVQQWIKDVDLSQVPNIPRTQLGACSNSSNSQAVTDAAKNGWWTCGAHTRASDITFCPNKNDWGASFDDGPSPYTPRLLNLLEAQDISTTFFIVGSRAISRPEMVQAEYMLGHQLSVHSWAHSSLTTLSNEEIIAELGWTKKIIHDITGVTPNTMRPPYGDIDDRVRYISLKLGLRPIIWTTHNGATFDTRDWQIGGGVVSATDAYMNFDRFLDQAVSQLNTGFIVLAHDLYQQSVDLAVDYILPKVINAGQLKMQTIADCLGEGLSNAYIETADNSTHNPIQTTSTVVGASGTGFVPNLGATQSSSGSSGSKTSRTSGSQQSQGAGGSSGTNSSSKVQVIGSGGIMLASTLALMSYLLA
ncbi:uncharacterized protein JCM15063_000238 [Sporobolomyces koalae]|uniref:uncharacterized protein n=1 Tax=Sporobolomyces koalae TaxID=500713 RepID=UPI0031711437